MRSRVSRALRVSVVVTVALVLLLFLWVQADQQLLRWRAKRLLADMQAVTLHESTWADAQRMMNRWGAWGHYDGTCTSESCRYEIGLFGTAGVMLARIPERASKHLPHQVLDQAYRLAGMQGGMLASFIVQDGRIVRKGVSAELEVPPSSGLLFFARVVSVQSVIDEYSLNHAYDFSSHPDYTPWRPGACTVCVAVTIFYSDRAPKAEVKRLESLNVDCFGMLPHCPAIEDLLPASEPYHFYNPWATDGRPARPGPLETGPGLPCAIPVWVLGRDASTVLDVEVLRSRSVPNDWGESSPEQEAEVHVWNAVKGSAEPYSKGTVRIRPRPYTGGEPGASAEQFQVGKRYFVLNYPQIEDELKTGSRDISLDRCEVLPDTPGNRKELLRGAALNDHLRQPEFNHLGQ